MQGNWFRALFGRPAREARRATARPRPFHPRLDVLEDRTAPAGNIHVTSFALSDPSGVGISNTYVGVQVFGVVRYNISGFSGDVPITVKYTLDGTEVVQTRGNQSNGDGYFAFDVIGYAQRGTQVADVTVTTSSPEDDTSDNHGSFTFTPATATPKEKYTYVPIGGVPFKTWGVVNYVDVKANFLVDGSGRDYRGGLYTYNIPSENFGHDAFDTTVGTFSTMDRGVLVRAAAGGKITQLVQNQFDRQTGFESNVSNNTIVIDLGNGFQNIYDHFSTFTALVKEGDTVVAGQPLALVGSAGFSSLAHLHFETDFNLSADPNTPAYVPVETMLDPFTFWADPDPYPLTYQGDMEPTVVASGLTSYDPVADPYNDLGLEEAPAATAAFAPGQKLYYWYATYARAGDAVKIEFYRPDGTLRASFPYTSPLLRGGNPGDYVVQALETTGGDPLGLWHARVVANGQEIDRQYFLLTQAGAPTLHVSTTVTVNKQNDSGYQYIVQGRSSPISFGSVAVNGAGPVLKFRVANLGSAPLVLSGQPVVPAGFTLAMPLPSLTLAPGEAGEFELQLDSSIPDAGSTKLGQVLLYTNALGGAPFAFIVAGEVTGAAPTGSPTVNFSYLGALAYPKIGTPVVIDPLATVVDDTSSWASGTLTAQVSINYGPSDVIGIRNQGRGPGQIGVFGRQVYYSGRLIGVLQSTGSPSILTVLLNANATTAAVEALVRNLTYTTTAANSLARHTLQLSITDGTGLASNRPNKNVVVLPAVTTEPGKVARLTVSAPRAVAAGQPFRVTVTALDAAGNVVTDFQGFVKLTSNDPRAPLLLPHLFSQTDRGVFTFTGVGLRTAGNRVLGVRTLGGEFGTARIQVVAGAAARLILVPRTPATALANAPLAPISGVLLDRFGNRARGAVLLNVVSGPGGFVGGPAVVPAVNGVATFAGLALGTPGRYRLRASLGGLIALSGLFDVV